MRAVPACNLRRQKPGSWRGSMLRSSVRTSCGRHLEGEANGARKRRDDMTCERRWIGWTGNVWCADPLVRVGLEC